MKINKSYIYIFFLVALSLSGCSKKEKYDDSVIVPANELYQNGLDLIAVSKFKQAAEKFSQLFYQHPGNELTPKAELMQGYSLYEGGEYDEAIDVLENFINLHPMHEDIAYAYYLRALAAYMQISNVSRDQSKTEIAKEFCEDVIKRFPNSKYSADVTLKIDLINEHLAGKEMTIGRYYFNKNNPIAALKRFKEVVDNYQTTSHVQEALYRMVSCYMQLGLISEAQATAAILGYNYPDSKWYQHSYQILTPLLNGSKS